MDTRTRTAAGWVVAAVGVIILLIGLLADPLGLGDSDFGGRQLAAVIVGIVIAAIGLATALWSRSKDRQTANASTSTS